MLSSEEWNTKDPRDASLDSSDESGLNEEKDETSLKDDGKNAGRWTDEEHAKFLEAL